MLNAFGTISLRSRFIRLFLTYCLRALPFPFRLEEQMKQRTRLLEQFDRNVKERESLLNKKNDALSSLSDVERTLVAIVEE